jgi:hypothetical protein
MAIQLGFAVGVIYHFVIQYPLQAGIFTTLYSSLGVNIAFMILVHLGDDESSFTEGMELFLVFNCTWGSISMALANEKITTAAILKIVYNVYFRHRGVPTKFWWAATDLRYWNAYRSGQSHGVIAQLHRELGQEAFSVE